MGEKLSPAMLLWLASLPAKRSPRRTGLAARAKGFTDDLVRDKKKRVMLVSEARDKFGPEWFTYVEYTGEEGLTPKGKRALESQREVS